VHIIVQRRPVLAQPFVKRTSAQSNELKNGSIDEAAVQKGSDTLGHSWQRRLIKMQKLHRQPN